MKWKVALVHWLVWPVITIYENPILRFTHFPNERYFDLFSLLLCPFFFFIYWVCLLKATFLIFFPKRRFLEIPAWIPPQFQNRLRIGSSFFVHNLYLNLICWNFRVPLDHLSLSLDLVDSHGWNWSEENDRGLLWWIMLVSSVWLSGVSVINLIFPVSSRRTSSVLHLILGGNWIRPPVGPWIAWNW